MIFLDMYETTWVGSQTHKLNGFLREGIKGEEGYDYCLGISCNLTSWLDGSDKGLRT